MNLKTLISRNEEIDSLKRGLDNNNLIFVSGERGVGKSTLLNLFERKFGNNYSQVIRISIQIILNDVELKSQILTQLNPRAAIKYYRENGNSFKTIESKSLLNIFKQNINRNGKYLLLIDDINYLNNYRQLQNSLIQEILEVSRFEKSVQTIITTSGKPIEVSLYDNLVLRKFNLNQTLDYLNLLLTDLNFNNNNEMQNLSFIRDELLGKLDGNPSLINLAAHSLIKTKSTDEFNLNLFNEINKRADSLIIEYDNGILKPSLSIQNTEANILFPNNELVNATPYLYSPSISTYWKNQLNDFEKLINSIETKEQHIQNFFEQNSDFLKGFKYKNVIAQPILKYDDGAMKPDFFLCPHSSFYSDILELKLPKEKLISGRENRTKFSSKVEDAIAQVRHYRDYFQSPNHRDLILKKYGVTVYKPKITILIGKTPVEISKEKLLELKDITERDKIEIITYDEIFAKMKRMTKYK